VITQATMSLKECFARLPVMSATPQNPAPNHPPQNSAPKALPPAAPLSSTAPLSVVKSSKRRKVPATTTEKVLEAIRCKGPCKGEALAKEIGLEYRYARRHFGTMVKDGLLQVTDNGYSIPAK
jgi:hypothetical protein